jgi:hypothetical protein
MSLADDVDVGDEAVLARCRSVELTARRVEGELITELMEIERRRAYLADGHRCLAAYGRGGHRWDPRSARSRRGLVRLSLGDERVIDRLLEGRIGVPQAHLLGRLFEMPRVGQYVLLFLDMFLEWAAMLDYVDFDEQVRTWRLLVDQDGSDPERAHRQRSLRIGMSDHQYAAAMNGPAIDGVRLKSLLQRFEDIEWDIDWAATVAEHGDLARPDLTPRSPAQRRYDAFQNLLDHVHVPARRARADSEVDDLEELDDAVADGLDSAAETDAEAEAEPSAPPPGMQPVVNLIADIDTFLAALDRVFDGDQRRPFPVPFGPGRGRSHDADGEFVSPQDIVLAAIAGQVRLLLTNQEGQVISMTRRTRFFRGALRDAALATATRCGHPGCLERTSRLQVDHATPDSHGGDTSMDNSGGGACGHHNNWRYTTSARVRRHRNGRLTTHRRDGTDIAPPD